MKKHARTIAYTTPAILALGLVAIARSAPPGGGDLITLQSGTPAKAADVNNNFGVVMTAAQNAQDTAGDALAAASHLSSGNYSFVGGGTRNTASGNTSAVVGGADNVAGGAFATVGGGIGNSATGDTACIGGGLSNQASAPASTISGGRQNVANDDRATVSGGTDNTAGKNSTVGGGFLNTATMTFAGDYAGATVGGGKSNQATFPASTVAGGETNVASSYNATVSGGQYNTAGGFASTVSGGHKNVAAGDFSFAAGRRAQANHVGSFVWGDSTDVDKPSSANDEFNVYATGGMRVFTGQTTPSLGVDSAGNVSMNGGTLMGFAGTGHIQSSAGGALQLNPFAGAGDVIVAGGGGASNFVVNTAAFKPGGGSWSVLSDARQKHDIQPLEGSLERLMRLKGRTYFYNDLTVPGSAPGQQIGFIAQDVENVFPQWVEEVNGNKTLSITGFEALSVESLRELRAEKDEQVSELKAENAELRSKTEELTSDNAELRERVTRLESVETEVASLKAAVATLLENR